MGSSRRRGGRRRSWCSAAMMRAPVGRDCRRVQWAWPGNFFDPPFEGSYRVPAMVRWPGHIPAGQVSEDMVRAVDWLPDSINDPITDVQLPSCTTFSMIRANAGILGSVDGYGMGADARLSRDVTPLLAGSARVHIREADDLMRRSVYAASFTLLLGLAFYVPAVKRACFVRAHQCPIRNLYLNTALEAAIPSSF